MSATQERPAAATVAKVPKPPLWRRAWFVGTLAFVVGAGIGALGASDTAEIERLGAQITERDERIATLEEQVTSFEELVSAANERVSAAEQRAEDQIDSALAGLRVREDELEQAEARLDERAAKLDRRQRDLEGQEAAVAAGTVPGDGLFLVGVDIEPGQYRGNGGGTCYWARLSGTSGDFDEVIANDLPSGPTVVTINPSDEAFETSGCGEWRRM